MFSNLLHIPFRICEVRPLHDILAELIKKDYFQPVASFENDLNAIQHLQSSIASLSREKDPNVDQFEAILYEYYHMLSGVKNKFVDHCVHFEWYGTLRYQPKHCSFTSWKQEQLQLVYEMGALASYRAVNGVISDEGLKAACASMKRAAGFFEVLLKEDQQTIAGIPDFDTVTLQCLKTMLIAQAQELVWSKAATGKTVKDHIVARLSMKVSEYYKKAAELGEEAESITLDWINHFKVKADHFEAAARYRMSLVALDSFEYGLQVGHLKLAAKLCDEAAKYKRYVSKPVVEELQGLTEMVQTTLKSAEKDNDLVYLKPVPPANSIPGITGASMVEPEVPSDFFQKPERNEAFQTLVPFSLIQIAQAFRERQDHFVVDKLHEPLGAMTRMYRKFLAERDLPASMDSIQKPENVPDSILQHSQEIVSMGGTKLVESSMLEIGKLGKQCQDLIEACNERLSMERYEDKLMRERSGSDRWNRPTSETAAAELITRVTKMAAYLEQGQQSDSLIMESYNSVKDILAIYCGGKQKLVGIIPRSSHAEIDLKVGQIIGELRELLSAGEKIEQSKQRFINSVSIKSRDHSILPVIMNSYKKNPDKFVDEEGKISSRKFEAIYEHHIKAFDMDVQHVESLKQKQMDLEKKIHEANIRLNGARETIHDASQMKRHQALRQFEDAYVAYLDLVSNLSQASKFYADFLDKGNAVLDDVEHFLYQRREEARELSLNIENQEKFRDIGESMQNERQHVVIAAPRSQKVASSKDIHIP